MIEVKKDSRELIFQLEEDESVDLVLRNRKTGKTRKLRTWFMPTLLSLNALKTWRELETPSD